MKVKVSMGQHRIEARVTARKFAPVIISLGAGAWFAEAYGSKPIDSVTGLRFLVLLGLVVGWSAAASP